MTRALPPTAAPTSPEAWRAGLVALRTPQGEASAQFTRALTEWLRVPAVWPTSSGRAALFLLLEAMRALRPERREVLLPAYTCPVLVPVIDRAGLRPRLVDVSLPDLSLDSASLAERLSGDTLALIHVHPFGLPRPVEGIRSEVHAAGAWLIEDAAQAMGARLDGQRVGGLGDASLFSLGPGKALSTGGGGLLAVRDERLIEPIQQFYEEWHVPSRWSSANTLTRLAVLEAAFRPVGWRAVTTLRLNNLGDSETLRGFVPARLSDAQAAVGIVGLAALDAMNAGRRLRAEQMLAELGDLPAIQPVPAGSGEPIYVRLPLLVAPVLRERLLGRLRAAGLGAGRMYPQPLHHLFPHLNDGPFPGAEAVASQLLTLPTHAFVSAEDVSNIVDIVRTTADDFVGT